MTTPESQRPCWPQRNREQPEFSTKPESMSSGETVRTSRSHVGPDALFRVGEQSSPGVSGGADRKTLARVNQPNLAGLLPTGRVEHPPLRGPSLDCASFAWPTRLAVRIVPRSTRPTSEVFGVAFLSDEGTGCYSDVFYDQAMELHADWHVSLSDLLGNVMAHELGHLLLGSNSHSRAGVMRAHWQEEELHSCREATCGSQMSRPTRCSGN